MSYHTIKLSYVKLYHVVDESVKKLKALINSLEKLDPLSLEFNNLLEKKEIKERISHLKDQLKGLSKEDSSYKGCIKELKKLESITSADQERIELGTYMQNHPIGIKYSITKSTYQTLIVKPNVYNLDNDLLREGIKTVKAKYILALMEMWFDGEEPMAFFETENVKNEIKKRINKFKRDNGYTFDSDSSQEKNLKDALNNLEKQVSERIVPVAFEKTNISSSVNNENESNYDENLLHGIYDIYYMRDADSIGGIEYSSDYVLDAQGNNISIAKKDSTEKANARTYNGNSEYLQPNLYFEFTDSKKREKIYWIFNIAGQSNPDYLSGVFLTANIKLKPQGGPIILIKKHFKIDPDMISGFFMSYKFSNNSVVKEIDDEVLKRSVVKFKQLKQLAGKWKVIRWNEPEDKYSIYRLEIDENLKIKCFTEKSGIFDCKIRMVGNDRIIIEGWNELSDIYIMFSAKTHSRHDWNFGELKCSIKRISTDNIRYGECLIRKTIEQVVPKQSAEEDLDIQEREMANKIGKRIYCLANSFKKE